MKFFFNFLKFVYKIDPALDENAIPDGPKTSML